MRRSGITLSDVAEQAGVSKFTASVVLNGSRSNTRVSDTTRQRIEDAARTLRYYPNAVARSLSRSRTNVIGFHNGHGHLDPRATFMAEILAGFQHECMAAGRDLLTHSVSKRFSVDQAYGELVSGKVDGLVLYCAPNDPLVQLLADAPIPVVAIVDAIPTLPCIVVDDLRGAQLQAEHLAERGHKHVLYRCGHNAISLNRRREMFHQAARNVGITVVNGYETHPSNFGDRYRHPLSPHEWYIIQSGTVSAVVCWTDSAAYSLLLECADRGVRVPDDIAVIGFNGVQTEMPLRWELTTVRAPFAQVARTAVTQLISHIQGKEAMSPPTSSPTAPELPRQTVLPVELVLGETT